MFVQRGQSIGSLQYLDIIWNIKIVMFLTLEMRSDPTSRSTENHTALHVIRESSPKSLSKCPSFLFECLCDQQDSYSCPKALQKPTKHNRVWYMKLSICC